MDGFLFSDSGRSADSGFNPGNRDARIDTGLMLTKAEKMARQALEGRDEAMDAIRAHLATHGKTGLSDLRETRWGHVNPKTWYAWVATAKSPKVTPQALADARRVLASAIDDPEALGRAVGAVLPAIPSPASIAAMSPGEARRSLNLFARWETLWQDCEMVRSYAVKTTDSGESIRLLKAFCQSISMRGHILRSLMEALGQLWSIRRMQDFHDAVVDEVAKESPECAARILARLSALSDDCGMTLEARV